MLDSSQNFWKAQRISLGNNHLGILARRSTQPGDICQTTEKRHLTETTLLHDSYPRRTFTTLNLVRKSELPLWAEKVTLFIPTLTFCEDVSEKT